MTCVSLLLRRLVLGAGLLGTACLMAPAPASAQSGGGVGWFWEDQQDEKPRSTRKIVPFAQSYGPGTLIVSFGDRRLYYVDRKGQAISYPIAIPRDQDRWQGNTSVSSKRINPSWTPTPHMRAENPLLPTYVPGGHPRNPLGIRALYLGSSMYRIHGTDAPWTIGDAVSKGCIRMLNEDVVDLYPRVNVGTRVMVTWDHFARG